MFIYPISTFDFLGKVCNTSFFNKLRKIPNLSEKDVKDLYNTQKLANKYESIIAPYLFRLEEHSKLLNDMIGKVVHHMIPFSRVQSMLQKEALLNYGSFVRLTADQVRNILFHHIYFDANQQPEKKYQGVNANNLESFIKSSELVILHWTVTADPLYHALMPNINEVTSLYPNRVKVGQIKDKQAVKLAPKYSITYIPSLCFLHHGKLETTLVGYHSSEDLQATINTILKQ